MVRLKRHLAESRGAARQQTKGGGGFPLERVKRLMTGQFSTPKCEAKTVDGHRRQRPRLDRKPGRGASHVKDASGPDR